MNQKTFLPMAYRVAKLIDLNTQYPEIAARTGLTENDVREIAAWTKYAPDFPARTHGAPNVTETVVLHCLNCMAEAKFSTGEMEVAIGAETMASWPLESRANTSSAVRPDRTATCQP